MIFRTRIFQLGLLLTAALSVSIWSTASQAYTPEQQQACTNDAFRLCGSDVPDVDRITACMIRNKSQLSPECRAHFGPDPREAAASPAGQPPRKAVSSKPRKKKSAKPGA